MTARERAIRFREYWKLSEEIEKSLEIAFEATISDERLRCINRLHWLVCSCLEEEDA